MYITAITCTSDTSLQDYLVILQELVQEFPGIPVNSCAKNGKQERFRERFWEEKYISSFVNSKYCRIIFSSFLVLKIKVFCKWFASWHLLQIQILDRIKLCRDRPQLNNHKYKYYQRKHTMIKTIYHDHYM